MGSGSRIALTLNIVLSTRPSGWAEVLTPRGDIRLFHLSSLKVLNDSR